MSRAPTKSGKAAFAGKRKKAASSRIVRAKKSAIRKPSAGAASPDGSGSGGVAAAAPRTLTKFMVQALTMEREAAQRYSDLADAMDIHNNREVAALFRKMADIERKHATQIMEEMGWKDTPALAPAKPSWDGFEAPETTPGDEVHYLMQPYHALELALLNEQRAERFFARLSRIATVKSVREAAKKLQAEEQEHVEMVRAWMKKVPKPDPDWANDPDPASYTD
jgi:rubrerythrin